MLEDNILEQMRAKVRDRDYYFTLHAGRRMVQRHISVGEFEEVVLNAASEVIEDYPNDPRGKSCLILGRTQGGRILHVQCALSLGMAVVTVYDPSEEEWIDWRVRRQSS